MNFELVLDLLFPKRCLGCGKFGAYICLDCQKILQPLREQICPVCTRQAISGVTHPGCRGRYELDGLSVFFPYRGIIRKALRKYKYGRRLTDLTGTLITLVYQQIPKHKSLSQFIHNQPGVLPVPLHWLRKLVRGFNQAELLGKELSRQLHLPFEARLLKRIRYTKPQFGLTKKEREENIRKAFVIDSRVQKNIHRHSSIILFDDIWTTGATMRACAKVLKKAGVKSVWALTIAR